MFKAFIMGRLTADPTQREVGTSRCTEIKIACDTKMKDPNGAQSDFLTNFMRATFWGKQADAVMKFFHKGDGIACTGDCAVRTYKGKDDKEYVAIDVMNADFAFPPGKSGGNTSAKTEEPVRTRQPQPQPQPVDEPDDSLPF